MDCAVALHRIHGTEHYSGAAVWPGPAQCRESGVWEVGTVCSTRGSRTPVGRLHKQKE